MEQIYDPIKFVNKIELFTFAIIGSFITMKFLNAIYENIYEPAVDVVVNSDKCDHYYINIGKYYIQTSMIIKEFIKWIMLIIILMFVYNLIHRTT